jgi:hypothetical protein
MLERGKAMREAAAANFGPGIAIFFCLHYYKTVEVAGCLLEAFVTGKSNVKNSPFCFPWSVAFLGDKTRMVSCSMF